MPQKPIDIDPKPLWFHADYKANGGSEMHQWVMGPASWADADDPSPAGYFQSDGNAKNARNNNGVCYQHSLITNADIADGTVSYLSCGRKKP